MIRILFLVVFLASAFSFVYADHPTGGLGSDSTGPIITIGASTLAKGHWGFVTRFEYANFDSFTDEELIAFAESGVEGVHSLDDLYSPFFGLGYGLTDNFTISARIPYVKRTNIREGEIEEHEEEEGEHQDEEPAEAETHVHGDSSGIGDLIVFGQYRFVNNTSNNLGAALLLGIKLPTGKDDVLDAEGIPFETEHQPGTGSVDPLFGVAITRTFERISIDSNVLYTKTTEGAQDTDLGDLFHYNVAFSYRLVGEGRDEDHSDEGSAAHHHYFWDVALELNGEYQQHHDIAGQQEENSGGTLVYITPGIRFSATGLFSAFFSVGIPIIQDLNGTQHETTLRLLTGVGFGF